MDDETLSGLFPNDDLDANEYYLDYERSFEWYFDDVYCQYADFQDYQRLVLRNTVSNTWLWKSFEVMLLPKKWHHI
jgi:hypothetical protein